jgi:hypothetical protein
MDPCPWTRFKFFDLRMKYLSVGVISDVTPGEQRSAILMESFGCDVQSLLPLVKSGYARGLSCTSSVRAKLTIDCWWSLVIALQYYVQIEDRHLDSLKKNPSISMCSSRLMYLSL